MIIDIGRIEWIGEIMTTLWWLIGFLVIPKFGLPTSIAQVLCQLLSYLSWWKYGISSCNVKWTTRTTNTVILNEHAYFSINLFLFESEISYIWIMNGNWNNGIITLIISFLKCEDVNSIMDIWFGQRVPGPKCYPGGRKIHSIPSISKIHLQMWYHCVKYTKRHRISLISHL